MVSITDTIHGYTIHQFLANGCESVSETDSKFCTHKVHPVCDVLLHTLKPASVSFKSNGLFIFSLSYSMTVPIVPTAHDAACRKSKEKSNKPQFSTIPHKN